MSGQNNKCKILYINGDFCNESGASVIARNTYYLFKNNEYDAEIFTTENCFDEKGYKYANLFSKDIRSFKEYIKNPIKYYYNREAQYKIEKLLDDFNPNIVHIHSLRIPSLTYSVLKPIIKRRIPIIMTLHDCFLVCPMMTLIKGNGENCVDVKCKGFNKFNCVFNNCGKNIEQSFRLALMSFVNKITGYDKYITKFITPSEALKKLLINANIGIKESDTITVNTYVRTDDAKLIQQNNGYFLYVGRLSKEKGINYLLKAMESLPRNIELHIVGKGPMFREISDFIDSNNLSNIKLLGFVSDEVRKQEYQNCIATILPCNWFENCPATPMEGFTYGKPAIASNIGGIPEIVEHNITGFLVEPANVEQLKEYILKYWNNPDIVIEHGKNAYNKVTTLYCEKRYYNDLDKVYKEVIDGSKNIEIKS